MLKIFKTLDEYNTYTDNGQVLDSGFLYYVKEDGSFHIFTNNIDGDLGVYDSAEQPTGNIEITENGEAINIGQYATATVNVASSPTDLINLIERDITSLNISSGTNKIGQYAFYNCYSLTSVTIPNSVTAIEMFAFRSCSGLTSVTIPNSVTTIGNDSFSLCSGLTSVTIGNGITAIGNNAFKNDNKLTSVTINATTPPTLGTDAFTSTNNCPIYVPSASVDTYKAASGWSTYASRIQAIS